MTANAERGEVAIDLEGVPHVLRPSYEALVAIEAQTGKSVEQLADAAGSGAMTVAEAATVVTECVKAHGKAIGDATLTAYNTRRVGECIVEAGKLAAVKRLELLLFLAATGGYDAKGNVKAPPTMTVTAGQDEAGIAA